MIIKYLVQIDVPTAEHPDFGKVDQLLTLAMQDLAYDDQFVQALDEKQSVTVQAEIISVG